MNFDFFKYRNQLQPEKGRLLISEPFLNDPNFERTVVLLCEHNQDGSFGFVLNKQSIVKINDVLSDLSADSEAFVGGPVQQDTIHYLHRIANLPEAIPIAESIYWGGDFDALQSGLDIGTIQQEDVRFFLGYSGWGAGQLEEEIKNDSWIVCDYITSELLFDSSPAQMWKQALSNMGGRFSVYSNYPIDPNLN
jgi:putative transcriptional regulator